ncbi:hypothetical protein KBY97_00535 [Synechococcus sp. ATX 2A4]|uniref:ATP-binding protein n=1 Tax=Synechococcus sp. ATX 2A4 TaxID=2823727 RepID=UPI0020CE5DA3|nr:ATP-binding protein [Synechococcus sp. ATX 2A4]MCP9883613.1 hypothetical protein [Synechococcus sp. ATX 2A4]
MATSLRFHLLIGPPLSGKTPLASRLVSRLEARGREALELTVSEALQEELEWMPLQESFILTFFRKAAGLAPIAGMRPGGMDPLDVVIDGTAITRAQRLRYMQMVDQAVPIEWIGWWLHTPLDICLRRNSRRPSATMSRQAIIEAFWQLRDRRALPSIEEGFSALVQLDPFEFFGKNDGDAIDQVLDLILDDLPACCADVAAQRQGLQLHAYSRLIEFERLMQHLSIRLNVSHGSELSPGISEPSDRSRLRIMAHTEAEDLDWMLNNRLILPRVLGQSSAPIHAPEPPERTRLHWGGWHRYADARAFEMLMEELRLYMYSSQDEPHPSSADLQELIARYSLQPWDSDRVLGERHSQP